jgi:hypothetical protein
VPIWRYFRKTTLPAAPKSVENQPLEIPKAMPEMKKDTSGFEKTKPISSHYDSDMGFGAGLTITY